MVMIKDNHVAICGSIQESVQKVRSMGDFSSKIEQECSSLEEAEQAMAAGVDVILLDNFAPKVSQTNDTISLILSLRTSWKWPLNCDHETQKRRH